MQKKEEKAETNNYQHADYISTYNLSAVQVTGVYLN